MRNYLDFFFNFWSDLAQSYKATKADAGSPRESGENIKRALKRAIAGSASAVGGLVASAIALVTLLAINIVPAGSGLVYVILLSPVIGILCGIAAFAYSYACSVTSADMLKSLSALSEELGGLVLGLIIGVSRFLTYNLPLLQWFLLACVLAAIALAVTYLAIGWFLQKLPSKARSSFNHRLWSKAEMSWFKEHTRLNEDPKSNMVAYAVLWWLLLIFNVKINANIATLLTAEHFLSISTGIPKLGAGLAVVCALLLLLLSALVSLSNMRTRLLIFCSVAVAAIIVATLFQPIAWTACLQAPLFVLPAMSTYTARTCITWIMLAGSAVLCLQLYQAFELYRDVLPIEPTSDGTSCASAKKAYTAEGMSSRIALCCAKTAMWLTFILLCVTFLILLKYGLLSGPAALACLLVCSLASVIIVITSLGCLIYFKRPSLTKLNALWDLYTRPLFYTYTAAVTLVQIFTRTASAFPQYAAAWLSISALSGLLTYAIAAVLIKLLRARGVLNFKAGEFLPKPTERLTMTSANYGIFYNLVRTRPRVMVLVAICFTLAAAGIGYDAYSMLGFLSSSAASEAIKSVVLIAALQFATLSLAALFIFIKRGRDGTAAAFVAAVWGALSLNQHVIGIALLEKIPAIMVGIGILSYELALAIVFYMFVAVVCLLLLLCLLSAALEDESNNDYRL